MKSKIEIIESLHKIISEREPIRMGLIKSFQNKVWEDESIKDETLNEILSGLAYDLDFYEPNEDWRKEDPSYYGDECLEKEIRIVIQKLQALNPE